MEHMDIEQLAELILANYDKTGLEFDNFDDLDSAEKFDFVKNFLKFSPEENIKEIIQEMQEIG